MLLKKWEHLPSYMQNEKVKPYYDFLKKKTVSLIFKRLFDIVVSLIMLVLLSPFFLVLAVAIKIDSKGPVFFRQERVTQYGRKFRIFKFRSMAENSEKQGPLITSYNDLRITKVGRFIRKCRLDEISQLINVLAGSMTFVGTRPEVSRYVEKYSDEMMATLLLPAGITSKASIYFKDEDNILKDSQNSDKTYCEIVLPQKMKYNLKSIMEFSFFKDIVIMFQTFFAVLGKEYKDKENTVDIKNSETFYKDEEIQKEIQDENKSIKDEDN